MNHLHRYIKDLKKKKVQKTFVTIKAPHQKIKVRHGEKYIFCVPGLQIKCIVLLPYNALYH